MNLRSTIEQVKKQIITLLKRAFFWIPNTNKIDEKNADSLHDHALVLAVTEPELVPKWKQFKYALKIFTPNEKRLLITSLIVIVFSLLFATTWFVIQHIAVLPAVGGTFTEGFSGQPKYLNPIDAINNDVDRDIVRLIYSGLFKYDGLHIIPDMAESYAWSDENKTLTVKIREDARFHDGQPVTAEDVHFTITSIQDPDRKNPQLPIYKNITMETSGDSTIIFHIPKTDVHFLDHLTMGILPSHVWSEVPTANARLSDLNFKPIGSGPYRIKSFSKESNGLIHSYTLERFEYYYGVKPYIQTLNLQFFSDKNSALDAFKSDQLDALAFVSNIETKKMVNSSRTKHVRMELPQETIAFINVQHPLLANADIRKALLYSIDRNEIVTLLHSDAVAIYGPFPFENVQPIGADIDSARTLLTSAGWILAPGSVVRIKNNQELAVTISVPNEPGLLAIADVLKRRWSLLGVKVTIQSAGLNDIVQSSVRDRSTAMITLLNVFLGPEQDIFSFWWSGQAVERGLNISGVSDRNIDDSLEKMRNATSPDALTLARSNATSLISNTYAAGFLVRPVYTYLVSSSIFGMPEQMTLAAPAERYQSISSWYKVTNWRWK